MEHETRENTIHNVDETYNSFVVIMILNCSFGNVFMKVDGSYAMEAAGNTPSGRGMMRLLSVTVLVISLLQLEYRLKLYCDIFPLTMLLCKT